MKVDDKINKLKAELEAMMHRKKSMPKVIPKRSKISADFLEFMSKTMDYYYSDEYHPPKEESIRLHVYEKAMKWVFGDDVMEVLDRDVFSKVAPAPKENASKPPSRQPANMS